MAIFHHHHEHDPKPSDDTQSVDDAVADDLGDADYDAQSDLALPTHHGGEPGEVFAPYAGTVVPDEPQAGYDVDRDTGF
jgi:hypothetical protein